MNKMNKIKLLIAVIGVIGTGGLLWGEVSDTAMPRVKANESLSQPSKDSASAPAKAAWTSAPDWHDRVNHLIQTGSKECETCNSIEAMGLAEEVALKDIRAALDYVMQLGVERSATLNGLGLRIFKRWADHAPAEAAQWLAGLPASSFSSSAHVYLANVWVIADLDGALAWMKTLPVSPHKKEVQLAVATGAASQGKAITAMGLLSFLPPDSKRDEVLRYAVQVWATKDRKSALDWLNGVEDPTWREEILGKIAINWAITQPMEAAQFALDSIPPGKSQQNAIVISVRNWAVQAPDQASAWVGRLPEGALRNAAIESIAEVWAKENPGRATEWLNSLPAGDSRDKAVGMFALTLASTSPEQAARWADKIQNETLRVNVRNRLKNQ
jgi:hypothetical protein